ncbi:delta 1-pyrroline-5-carboxylate reductase [Tulasnella sp. 425]|nr:delta 1-pyrroline-5-carboxylate reductase [Tulasnella sp. 425]
MSSSSGSSPAGEDVAMDASPSDDSNYDPLADGPPPLSMSASSSTQIQPSPSPKTPAPPTFETFTFSSTLPLPVQKTTFSKGKGIERKAPSLLSRMGDPTNEDSEMMDAASVEWHPARELDATPLRIAPKSFPSARGSLLDRISSGNPSPLARPAPTKQAAKPPPLAAPEEVAPRQAGSGERGRLLANRLGLGVTSILLPPSPTPNASPSTGLVPTSAPSPVASVPFITVQASAPSPATLIPEQATTQPLLSSLLPSSAPPLLPPPHAQIESASAIVPGPSTAPSSSATLALSKPVSKIFQRDPFVGTPYELPKSPTPLERLMAEVAQEQNEWAEVSNKLRKEDDSRAQGEERVQGLQKQARQREPEEVDRVERERRAIEERPLSRGAEEISIGDEQQRQEEAEATRLPTEEKESRREEELQRDSIMTEVHQSSSVPVPVSVPSQLLLQPAPSPAPTPETRELTGVEWLRQQYNQDRERPQSITSGGSGPSFREHTQVSPKAAASNAKSRAILALASSRNIPPSGSGHVGGTRVKTHSPAPWSPSRQRRNTSRVAPAPPVTWEQPEQKFEIPQTGQQIANPLHSLTSSVRNVALRQLGGVLSRQTETIGPAASSTEAQRLLPFPLIRAPRQHAITPEPFVKTEAKSEEASPVFLPTSLHPENDISAQVAARPSIPEVNERIFGDDQRPLRIPRQRSPSSPPRQLTTIHAEEETSTMMTSRFPPRAQTPGHLPPPLWHSEVTAGMEGVDGLISASETPSPSSPGVGLLPTMRVATSQPTRQLEHEVPLPHLPSKQLSQLAEQGGSILGVAQDSNVQDSPETTGPHLARPGVHQPPTILFAPPDHSNADLNRLTHQPTAGLDRVLPSPTEIARAHDLPSKPPQVQVNKSLPLDLPAKPATSPRMRMQSEPRTMLQESQSVLRTEEQVPKPDPYPNPLAGRSYGPPKERSRVPTTLDAGQLPNALGLAGSQGTTRHDGYKPSRTPPLPNSILHSTAVSDQGRKRERTGDVDHQTADFPPPKRHQAEQMSKERSDGVNHGADVSPYARLPLGNTEISEPRDPRVAPGRGRGFASRGRGRGAPRVGGHESFNEDRTSRSGHAEDDHDTRHYEDYDRRRRYYDRSDRDVDRRPAPYESHNSRPLESDYRTERAGRGIPPAPYRGRTPEREPRPRAPPRGPRRVEERQYDSRSYRDVDRDRHSRHEDSSRHPNEAQRMESYYPPRDDSRAYASAPRPGEIRRHDYSRYDEPRDFRRSRSPPARRRSPSPPPSADRYSRHNYDEYREGGSSSLSGRIRTHPIPSSREAWSENSRDYGDRAHGEPAWETRDEVMDRSYREFSTISSQNSEQEYRDTEAPINQAAWPNQTLEERGFPDTMPADPPQRFEHDTIATERHATGAPSSSTLGEVDMPIDVIKRLPPTSPRAMRLSFDHGQPEAETRRPESTLVHPQARGCGTMGIAITSGVLASLEARTTARSEGSPERQSASASGTSTPTLLSASDAAVPNRFLACVSRQESARKLRRTFGDLGPAGQAVEIVVGDNLQAIQESEVVILCCKPQQAQNILSLSGVKEALDKKLLISILAGVTISQLEDWVLPTTRVVRAMPNTPCRIREGMTVVSSVPPENALDREIIVTIFSSIGRCRFLDEKHFDACTALSGSGPAFVCLVLEAMADGGVMMGLPRAEALELAAQTLQGTARMALQSGVHPATIKDSVTTPGGCTIAGLLTLEDGRVRSTMARAIQVATQHAAALGQPSNGVKSKAKLPVSGYQTPHVVD